MGEDKGLELIAMYIHPQRLKELGLVYNAETGKLVDTEEKEKEKV